MTIEEMIAQEIPLPPGDAMPIAKRILDRLLSCRLTAEANEGDDYISWKITTTYEGRPTGVVIEDKPADIARWNRLVRGGRCA